jgi:hypothetical protein
MKIQVMTVLALALVASVWAAEPKAKSCPRCLPSSAGGGRGERRDRAQNYGRALSSESNSSRCLRIIFGIECSRSMV